MINKTTDMFLSDFMTAAIADAAGLSPAEVGIERTRIAGEEIILDHGGAAPVARTGNGAAQAGGDHGRSPRASS